MEKSVYVREMFASIAPRYDATNRLLTGGVDERWRKRAVRELAPPPHSRILDMCCGTGDLSFHLLRTDPTLHVTGVDFCEPMLDGARRRAPREAAGDVSFQTADVMARPVGDVYFDGVVPLIGGLVGGSKSAYRYLPNSLTNYPGADELAARFRTAGFSNVRFVRLAGGAIAAHVGTA
jgi:demethylmenaquinone methyltransferase/2-methoxy-6-polyprenyl-1,4-benzoquinol methylase